MKIVKSSCSSKRKVRTCTFSPQVNIKNKRTAVQTEQDVNAAHSEAKLQDLINDIKSNIYTKVKAVATSPEFGFDENEVDDYFFVEVSATEIGEDHHEAIRIEVRGEVSYEGLEDLMEALNPIIESYDSYAYFEPVEPGIIEAYVSVNQVDMSIYGATASPDHMFYDYHGKRFSVHDNSSEIGEDNIDDVYFLWKGSISQQAGAYNDADEDYVYAFIRGRGVIEYYKKGKYVATDNYTLRDEDDFEYAWEYMEIILQHICDRLIAYNKDVPDRMVHNSTDVLAASLQDPIDLDNLPDDFVQAYLAAKEDFESAYEEAFAEVSLVDDSQSNDDEVCAIVEGTDVKGKPVSGKVYLYIYTDNYDVIYQAFDETAEAIGLLEDNTVYSSVESSDYESDSGIFIEDIIDSLEDNGYDLDDLSSIKEGLWALFGYQGKDADDVIEDLVAGGFVDSNVLIDACDKVYSGTESYDYYLGDIVEYNGQTYVIIDDEDNLLTLRPKDRFGDNDFENPELGDSSEDVFLEPWQLAKNQKVIGASEDDEDDLPMVDQEYDSAATSINSNKLPAIYKMVNFNEGDIIVDFGGGKFDNAVEYIKDKGATLCVYDPYNRSAEHNKEVLRILRENGGADAAVNSNVLNVIKEPEARKNVLENIARITKPGAPIYITVYEGKGNGQEGPTKSGYQLNRKTADYLEEIQEVFPDATRRGKLITAHNSGSVSSSTNVEGYTDEHDISRYDKDIVSYREIISKSVEDSDDFLTDYTMYEVVTEDGSVEYECYFGDNDLYGPWNGEGLDFEADNYDEAVEWYNSYSSDEIQSSESVEGSILDSNTGFRENFEEAVDIFYEEYPATVELTDEQDEEYDTLYKAYVRETGVLYSVKPGVVYIDIDWDSSDILQALEETAEAIGIEHYPDPLDVDASESIEADAFSSLEDQYLTPPEYDDPIEHEDSQELIEVELDQVITVDVDGDYEWDDDTYVWASPDRSNEEWRSEDGVYIDDKVGVVEHIDDIIIPNVPTRPGKYRVTGLAELIYDVSGIQEYRTNYGPDDYESDLDTDHAVVSFNFSKSSVENLKITPVRR